MIRPGVAAPNLAPRIGQEVVRERGGVEYRELQTRSLVNRCDSPRVPFEWTVNPYRGCAMGCRYCYAAYTHEYLGLEAADSFHTAIYAKTGDLEETTRRLVTTARRGERMALGTATDPYQPGETDLRVTRRFLERAAQVRGLRLGITTKGAIVLRDLDLLQRIHARSRLSVQISLNSLDADLLRRIEPWAPPPDVRIEVLRRLVEAGLSVGLSLSPILPGITDHEAEPRRAHRPGRRGRREAHVGVAAVPALAHAREVLRVHRPRVPALSRGLPAGLRRLAAISRGAYRKRIEDTVRRLREKHGLDREDAAVSGAYARLPEQLDLFSARPRPAASGQLRVSPALLSLRTDAVAECQQREREQAEAELLEPERLGPNAAPAGRQPPRRARQQHQERKGREPGRPGGAREGCRGREGHGVPGEDQARPRGQAAVETDTRPHVEDRRDRAEREERPGAPRHSRRRAAGERDRRGRGREGDGARELGHRVAAAPACVEAQSQESDGDGDCERVPERRAREGEGTREQERGERGVAEEEALGQGGARVASALATVEEPQAQGVARQKAGERGERQAHAGGGWGQDESQDHRLREEAPAAVLGRERHGPPGGWRGQVDSTWADSAPPRAIATMTVVIPPARWHVSAASIRFD